MFGQEKCVYQKIWYAIRGSVVVGWGVGWLWCWLLVTVGCWLLLVLVVGCCCCCCSSSSSSSFSSSFSSSSSSYSSSSCCCCWHSEYVPIACSKLKVVAETEGGCCHIVFYSDLMISYMLTSPPTENGDVNFNQSNIQCEIAMLLSKCIILHVFIWMFMEQPDGSTLHFLENLHMCDTYENFN